MKWSLMVISKNRYILMIERNKSNPWASQFNFRNGNYENGRFQQGSRTAKQTAFSDENKR